MLKQLSLAALIAASLSLPVVAQAADTDPSKVPAGTYAVESYHTQVQFTLSHFGFTPFHGDFSGATGTLKLDPKKLSATSLEVTVPVASVLTINPQLNDELKGDKWLDATQFPNATFKATKFKETGKGKATVEGEFTLHGVTKPVVFEAHFYGAGDNPLSKKYTVGFEVTGKIKRSEFGVKQYLPVVGDEVDLKIAAAFEKQD